MSMSRASTGSVEAIPELTLRDLAVAKLRRLCDGLGCAHLSESAIECFDLLSQSWSGRPALSVPYWPSDITDDGTPVEFSVAFAGTRTELRLLVEPRNASDGLADNWATGLELTDRLHRAHGANIERFFRIQHSFAPGGVDAKFAIWHSAALSSDGDRAFKVYLNPQIAGPSEARERVGAALAELGMRNRWDELSARMGDTGRLVYFSLDLLPTNEGRVKVYSAHHAEHADDLDAILSEMQLVPRGRVANWISRLTGGRRAFDTRSVQLCFSMKSDAPPSVTLYVPVRSHCQNDAEALERAGAFLVPSARERLFSGTRSMAGRALETGRSLVTYVALRPSSAEARVTVYLSPELYATAATRPTSVEEETVPRQSMVRELGAKPLEESNSRSFEEVIAAIENSRVTLSEHPFLQYLRSAVGTLEELKQVATRVAFFVMCFQDVLRLVRVNTKHPLLSKIATVHEAEDRGHDNWYLQDLERLGATVNVRDLFAAENETIRDMAYTQISDVLRSHDDCSRLAVVLSLEAAGAEYFSSVIAFIERQQRSQGLLYFARRHQKIEQNHDVFTGDSQGELGSIRVARSAFPEVITVVDRTFHTMTVMADSLLRDIRRVQVTQGAA